MALTKDKDSVGIVGLGIMGGAFAANLVDSGWTVTGFDIDPARCEALAAKGVNIAASAPDVAAACPVVLTSLPTLKALHSVAAELGGYNANKRIVMEMSTVPLADKQTFADVVSKAGHTVLDCPVSGTGAQAAVRDLILYPSGDSATIASLADMFAGFSRGWYDVGPFGNGTRMKFVANHLVAIHNVATAEALLLAQKAGLDLDKVVECIGNGAGTSRMFEVRGPLMAHDEYIPATMKMVNWMKDMDAIAGFARDLSVKTPMFDTTRPLYDQAMSEGRTEEDTAAVFAVMGGRGKPK